MGLGIISLTSIVKPGIITGFPINGSLSLAQSVYKSLVLDIVSK